MKIHTQRTEVVINEVFRKCKRTLFTRSSDKGQNNTVYTRTTVTTVKGEFI